MSRTEMVAVHEARYSPINDVMHRQDGGAAKAKKVALTGSGRAWREDEVRRRAGCEQERRG